MRHNAVTRRAAALVGLPVDVFVTRAINMHARNVIFNAEQALVAAGLRDEGEIQWREQERTARMIEKARNHARNLHNMAQEAGHAD